MLRQFEPKGFPYRLIGDIIVTITGVRQDFVGRVQYDAYVGPIPPLCSVSPASVLSNVTALA